MPMLLLVIGIGVVDCGATIWAGLKLKDAAEKEIAKGIDELVQNAPSIVAKAFEDMAGGNSNEG